MTTFDRSMLPPDATPEAIELAKVLFGLVDRLERTGNAIDKLKDEHLELVTFIRAKMSGEVIGHGQ